MFAIGVVVVHSFSTFESCSDDGRLGEPVLEGEVVDCTSRGLSWRFEEFCDPV